MKENKHGLKPRQEFVMGGIIWTIIQTNDNWVKCITSDCVEKCVFDKKNKNNFAVSSLCAYLNNEFLCRLIKSGAPKEMFEYFDVDLTTDDGLKNYENNCVKIGLITCEEYRLFRDIIPMLPNRWWWTATPDSLTNSYIRYVDSDGSLNANYPDSSNGGVRPLCKLNSEILASYLNRKNVEEHKKRDEVIDMMKSIATIWNINAEEVFGVKLNAR